MPQGQPQQITSYAVSLTDPSSAPITLTDAIQFSGNYANLDQSGTGTDIKYPTFAFSDDFILYESVILPERRVTQVAGTDVVAGNRYSIPVPDTDATVHIGPEWWGVTVSADPIEDLVIPYSYTGAQAGTSAPVQQAQVFNAGNGGQC